MSIQDIANIVNTLNRNLVKLAEKVAEHNDELYNMNNDLDAIEAGLTRLETAVADLTLRVEILERLAPPINGALTIQEEK